MQEIESLKLIGFTWNKSLIDLVQNSCTRKVSRLHLEILLIQEERDIDRDGLFNKLFTNLTKTVDDLYISSSNECMDPLMILRLFELKLWKSLGVIWNAEMDSGIFQLLLSKLLLWINCHTNLESCRIEIFLPRMMENVTIPTRSLRKDGYNMSVSVDARTKKFSFFMVLQKLQNLKDINVRRSLCISSTSTLAPTESSWTDEIGSGMLIVNDFSAIPIHRALHCLASAIKETNMYILL